MESKTADLVEDASQQIHHGYNFLAEFEKKLQWGVIATKKCSGLGLSKMIYPVIGFTNIFLEAYHWGTGLG